MLKRVRTRQVGSAAAAMIMALGAMGSSSGVVAGDGEEPSTSFDGLPPTLLVEDTGINPYHEDFRLPDDFDPPPGYYPEHAELIDLTLDAGSYADAVERDRDVWDNLEFDTLYAFNGTKIVGGIQFGGSGTPILDETSSVPVAGATGHGTAVASAAVGNQGGACPACRIMMAVGGPPERPHTWALEHDWVDALSTSHGDVAGIGWPFGIEEYEARLWTRSGRAWFSSAGNGAIGGPANHLDSHKASPHVLRVGRGDPPRVEWTQTFDLVGSAARPVALHDSLDEHRIGSGTSFAAPAVAGHFLMLVWEARSLFGDTEGVRDGVLGLAQPGAALPSTGPLADGVVTAEELQDVLMVTARQLPPPNNLALAPELSFWWEGFGMVDEDSMPAARAVLGGEAEPPERPWPAWWRAADQYARGAWGDTLAACKARYFDVVDCLQDSDWDPADDLPGPPPAND